MATGCAINYASQESLLDTELLTIEWKTIFSLVGRRPNFTIVAGGYD